MDIGQPVCRRRPLIRLATAVITIAIAMVIVIVIVIAMTTAIINLSATAMAVVEVMATAPFIRKKMPTAEVKLRKSQQSRHPARQVIKSDHVHSVCLSVVHVSVVVNESFVVLAKRFASMRISAGPCVRRLSGALGWSMVPEAADMYIRPDPDYLVQLVLSAKAVFFKTSSRLPKC